MKKKAIAIVMACIMVMALFTACASTAPAPKSEPTTTAATANNTTSAEASTAAEPEPAVKTPADYTGTVVYWQMNADPVRNDIYEQHVQGFSKIYPNVKVELSNYPANQTLQKIDLAAASNDMPDACDLGLNQVPPYALKGALVPLDDYIANWDEKDDILPALLENQRKYFLDNKIYSLPLNAQLGILWYRPDLFDAPKTWDEFYSTVEKFTDTAKKTYGFSIRGVNAAVNDMVFMYAYSGITDFFTPDGKCTINDPLHVEAMEKYFGMYKKNTPESDITNSFKEMSAVYDSGTAMMILHNTGSYSDHLKTLGPGKFGAARIPKPINGDYLVDIDQGFGGYVMGKNDNPNPDSTFAFISYLVGFEAESLRCKTLGIVPTNKKVFEEAWAKELPQYQLVMDALSSPDTKLVAPPIYLPDYNKICTDIADKGFQNVMLGNTTVKQVLDDMASAFEKANNEYKAMAKK